MFSKITLAAVNAYFNLMRKINCIPFVWSQEDQDLSVKLSKKTYFVLGVYYIWTLLYNLNIIASLHHAMQQETTDLMSITLDILFMLHFVCEPIMSVAMVSNRKAHAFFLSEMFQFNRELTEKFGLDKSHKRDGAEYLWMLVNSITNTPIMGTAFFVMKKESKRYLYNRIPHWLQIKPVFIGFCGMEYMSHVTNISILTFYFTEAFLYPRMINFWSRRIAEKVKGANTDHKSLLTIIGKMQVLNKLANECLSPVFFPLIDVIIIITGTIGLYGTIVLYHQLSAVEYACFPVLAAMMITGNFQSFHPAGLMKARTGNMLKGFVNDAQGSYWQKKVRSVQPLRLQAAFAFPFQETTSLVVLSIIFTNTISLVLLH